MNRYPFWKYAILGIALLIGVIFTLPNFFGEAPAVQVSSAKATLKVDLSTLKQVEAALQAAGVTPDTLGLEGNSVRARFATPDEQLKAKDAIEKALITDPTDPMFIVALNLVPRTPAWLSALGAQPMYLGLDLRGGVHFMLQVDMDAALTKKTESLAGDLRTMLRDKGIRHGGITRDGQTVEIRLRNEADITATRNLITDQLPDLQAQVLGSGSEQRIRASIKPEALRKVQEQALKQNITTLHNRINELGVAEPIIQQQGSDRVVVQLPGVQDTAKAKEILGRTATLEIRMVDESTEAHAAERDRNLAIFAPDQAKPEAQWAPVPLGSEVFMGKPDRDGKRFVYILKKEVLLTGNNLTDARTGFDEQSHSATVNLELDSKGAREFQTITRNNIDKRMAILLFEKGKGEVVTAPSIRTEIAGGRVQITGSRSTQEATDTALLLRSGSLAAPMEIVEERTIGPGLGAANIEKGFKSVGYGIVAIMIFMCAYYMLFGVFSALSLCVNLLMLVAILSLLQATLTLPGMAAMALTLGMAIDSNVLVNERIREELRHGISPQAAIHAGYQHAWATILDSNVTSLIAGLALLSFGTGAIRGFAVVHCLGILTSMFSAVFFSRGLVSLWYGHRRKIKSLSIGTVWRPENQASDATDDSKE